MSDVFISYASADRPRAALIAHALVARGWSVWWDRTIPPGRQFDEVIEEALDAARCVVVLWSKASTTSSWVKTEAAEAMRLKTLIPALIEEQVKIPLEFRRLQAADLTHWNGEPSTPEFDQFCDAIAGEVGAATPSAHRPAGGPAASAPAAPPFMPPPATPPVPSPPLPSPPPPSPPPVSTVAAAVATSPVRSKKTMYIVGGVVIVLLGIVGALQDQRKPARPAFNTSDDEPETVQPAVGGIHANLTWRDYVLAYSGNVSWDGKSNTAFIKLTVADSNTRQTIGNRELTAGVNRNGPGQIVLSTSVAVPGDSRTPGPHSHNVNLVFQSQGNGSWQFLRNCMSPDDCY